MQQCKNCHNTLDSDDTHETSDGPVCGECIDHYKQCECCQEYVHEDAIYQGERGNFCNDCWPDNKTPQDDYYAWLALMDERF